MAVAPSFANSVVRSVNAEFALGLLGEWSGSLDGLLLRAVQRGSATVAGSDYRPIAGLAMRDMVVL
jgi:hypothetical protein